MKNYMIKTAQKISLKNRVMRREANNGFTLVELLVVIAIIAVLAAVVVLIINPLELTRRSRDSSRLADLANLQNAVNVTLQESTGLPTAVLCASGITLPNACSGNSAVDARTSSGSGWVKVNVSGSPVSVSTLPVDPVNTTGSTGYHYLYCAAKAGTGSGYELVANLESQTYGNTTTGKGATDGGSDTTKYEVGSDLTILGTAGCAY